MKTNPNKELLTIQISCSPFQKLSTGESYPVLLSFSLLNYNNNLMSRGESDMDISFSNADEVESPINGEFIASPVIHCSCPKSCWFCAHMSAVMLLLYTIQQRKELGFDKLKNSYLYPWPLFHKLQFPLSLIFLYLV